MSKVRLYGNTSGYVDLEAPDVAGDVTITLPNATGPFALESYVDSAVAAIPGIGSNVVQTLKTDTFSASVAAGGNADPTDFDVTITPSSDTSKVFVMATISGSSSINFGFLGVILRRGSTDIAIGDADGVRPRITNAAMVSAQNVNDRMSVSVMFLDSPATAAAVTYSIRLHNLAAATRTLYLNRNDGNVNATEGSRTVSSITAIEVAV